MKRVLVTLFLIAAAVGAYVVLRGGRKPAGPLNVLLVTFDTLRVDAVGEGRGTPGFEAFFAEATRYAKARTVAPLTLPAHVSMLTGLLPARHAIRDNVSEPLPPREQRSFPLLAEELRDHGYTTAGFVAYSVVGEATGIASGFDDFDCPDGEEAYYHRGGGSGEDRVGAALQWIRGVPAGQPWFVWVHLYDAHRPYQAFGGDARRPAVRETDPLPVLYMGGVRRADAAFERLLGGVGPDTLVVVVSDHGEGLGEHDEPEHGALCYGPTVDAVLAVRGPGFRRGAVDTTLRSVADVAPTVRALTGLPPQDGVGRDLRGPPHEMLVTESLYTWHIHGWGQCFAVTDGDFTLVESGPRLELFDRRTDPKELAPQPLTQEAYEKLDRELERFRSGGVWTSGGELVSFAPPYGAYRRDVSGYLPRHENARLLDARANLPDWVKFETVPATIRIAAERNDRPRLEKALRLLDGFQSKWPESPRVSEYRALALAAMADVTRDRSWRSRAAREQLRVIEKGYVAADAIRTEILMSVQAEDRAVLRDLVRLLERKKRNLDPQTKRELEEAATKLGLEASDDGK